MNTTTTIDCCQILQGRTPWSTKAWRRAGQRVASVAGISLKAGMRRVAVAYAAVIPQWEGDWSRALALWTARRG